MRLISAAGFLLLAACTSSGSLSGTLTEPPDEATPTPEPTPDPGVCGDGVVDDGELCDDGINDALDGGCLPGCEEEDLYQEVFAGDLLIVNIEMDTADWDAMRHQRKTRHSVFGTTDCRTSPVGNPYTWFPGTVTIDGEVVESAGVRKKGHFGSQSNTFPSMKLKFDEFGDDDGRFHTMKRLALNNSKSDPSYMRMCSAYGMFRTAGIPAPFCTWAHVSLNGEPLGVYVATEEVKRPFLKRRFDNPDGNLYEGTACDFRPEYVGGFEQETNVDEDPSRSDLAAVYDVVQNAPDAELEAQLAELIDIDWFYRFWAVEGLIWFRDGYSGNANNYFMYADPTDGRFRFLPWGPDSTFRANGQGALPPSVLAYGIITNRLYALPGPRERYYQELFSLLEDSWDPNALLIEAGRVSSLLEPVLTEAEQNTLATQITGFGDIILGRQGVIEAAVADGYPDWIAGLRFNPCRTPISAVTGSFSTTWDTLGAGFYAAGESAMTLDGAPVDMTRGGARAGPLGDGRPRVQMQIETAGALRYTYTFTFPENRWFETYAVVGDHDLGVPPVGTQVIIQDISGDPAVEVARYDVTEGIWTFDSIEQSPDGVVSGSFDATFWALP